MGKPAGRSLTDFCDANNPLSPAEALLRDAARRGVSADLGPLPDRNVRASFLRFLVLGGDEAAPVHESGIIVERAVVADLFDLDECEAARSLTCIHCDFAGGVRLTDASLKGFALNGGTVGAVAKGPLSRWAGSIVGDRLKCSGSMFLIGGVSLADALLFDAANISGSLYLDGASVGASEGVSITLNGATIGGSLAMCVDTRSGEPFDFKSTGEIRLNGLSVKGNFRINHASMTATTTIDGVETPSEALFAYGLTVGGGFYFEDLVEMSGARMTGAKVAVLIDDLPSWQKGQGANKFDGFTYDRIANESPRSAHERQAWLETQSPYLRDPRNPHSETFFFAAPWLFAADSLEKLGLGEEARTLRIETARRSLEDAPLRQKLYLWPYHFFACSGFSVWPLIVTAVAVFFVGWAVIRYGQDTGAFCALGNFKGLQGQTVRQICPLDVSSGQDPFSDFHTQDGKPAKTEIASLVPVLYSLENEIPLLNFAQAENWKVKFGGFVWLVMTIQNLFGKIVVTGLVALFGAKLFKH